MIPIKIPQAYFPALSQVRAREMKFFLLFLGALVGVSSGLKTEDSTKGKDCNLMTDMLSNPKLLDELLLKSFDELFDMNEKNYRHPLRRL